MKTKSLLKTIFAGLLIFLALSLVTCELDLPGVSSAKGEVEYSDWEFVELPDGTSQLTLYLGEDGAKPYAVTNQSRALNLNVAKRSHDFFEAVFVAPGSPNHVARAVWEIGQTAGIRGVRRGIDYKAFTTGAGGAGITGTSGASTVLVGRKDGSTGTATLYAVGFLTHIDGTVVGTGTNAGVVTTTTKNVTFTVSALTTKVGYNISLQDPEQLAASPIGDADVDGGIRSTFLTAIDAAIADKSSIATGVNVANTDARLVAFNGARYTLFDLMSFNDINALASVASPVISPTAPPTIGPEASMGRYFPIAATYTIGGLTVDATDSRLPSGFYITTGTLNLGSTILHWDVDGTTANTNNFDVLERLAVYQYEGRLQEVIEANLDASTTVVLHNTATTTYAADNAEFDPVIPLEIRIREGSEGLFSFTFQTPVYALTSAESDNGTSDPTPVKWYIRPAHGQAQYLLDNGRDTGGCVLLGINISALGELLEILVSGLGFRN